MSGGRYRAVLFDLFGTLVHFDPASLPEIVIDGRRLHASLGRWTPLLGEVLPGVEVAAFWEALQATSREIEVERRATCVEIPSRERFRRTLARLDVAPAVAAELAPLLVRAHMRTIADVTCVPEEHRAVLDRVGRRADLAVVSNFDDTATAYEILERHGILARVQAVVVSEAVGLRKPHRALPMLALRALATAPDAALMVGDTLHEDVAAAAAAGIDAAWIDAARTGPPASAPVPRFTIGALREVEGLLDA